VHACKGGGALPWRIPSQQGTRRQPSACVPHRYFTYGYETAEKGKPLTFEINTATPDGRPAGVNVFYTAADKGFGSYQIR